MKKLLALFVSVAIILGFAVMPASATEKTYGLDNLNNEEGTLKVAFIGGSITYGGSADPLEENRYSTLVVENYFKEKFPNKTVEEINAGISGTPSDFGAFRTQEQLVAHEPDVVFVEFAANDMGYVMYDDAKLNVRANMESIVRQLLDAPKVPTIIFLYTHVSELATDKTPRETADLDAAIIEHQKIADYYGLGSINLHQHIQESEANGEYVWYDYDNPDNPDTLTNDGTHPNNKGHQEYCDYIIEKFEEDYDAYFKKPLMGKPHFEKNYVFQNPRTIYYDTEDATYTGDWVSSTEAFTNPLAVYPDEIETDWILSKTPGDSVTFNFTGRSIGLSYGRHMTNGGSFSWVIDEGTENEKSGSATMTSTSSERYLTTSLLMSRNLEYGEHTLKITNTGSGTNTYMGFSHFFTDDAEPVPVIAEVGEYDDYIPDTKRPENLLSNPHVSTAFTARNSAAIPIAVGTGTNTLKYTFAGVDGEAKFKHGTYYQIEGTHVGSTTVNDSTIAGFNGYLPDGPTSYVVEVKAMNISPEGVTPNMAVGLQTSKGTTDKEKASCEITSRGLWQTARYTLNLDCQDATDIIFQLGYDTNSVPQLGTVFQIYHPATYIAEEEVFDINVAAPSGKAVVAEGANLELKAEVLNQVGMPGYLTQDFTWQALNEERTQVVDGFTFTEGENGRVAVSVSEDVAPGYYVILASHDDATSIEKGVKKGIRVYVSDYSDYTKPSVIAGNLMDNENLVYNNNGHDVTKTVNGVYRTYTVAGTDNQNYWASSAGDNIGGIGGLTNVEAGSTYVIGFNAKNMAPTVVSAPKFGIGIDVGSLIHVDDTITQTDWQYVKGYVNVPASAKKVDFALGYSAPAYYSDAHLAEIIGASVMVDTSSIYIGKEAPYDIIIESANEIGAGQSITAKASVLNQIGEAGNLSQNFTWKMLDQDRMNEVEGFTLTAGENGTVLVTASASIEGGSYALVAESSDYPGFRMSKDLTISENGDYVPVGRNDNLVTINSSDYASFYNDNSSYISVSSVGEDRRYTVSGTGSVTGYYGYAGSLTGLASYSDGFERDVNYVVELKAKNETPEIAPAPSFGYAFNVNGTGTSRRLEGKTAKELTGNDWHTISNTFSIYLDGEDETVSKTNLVLGYILSSSTQNDPTDIAMLTSIAGAKVLVDSDSFYIAKERAYDITNVSENNILCENGSMTAKAEVVNQIGNGENMLQNFTWKVLDSDRKNDIDGFTVTKNQDGTVSVTAAEGVPYGEYVLLASSSDYAGFRKGLTFTYRAPLEEKIEELTLTQDGTTVTLDAKVTETQEEKILFFIAEYAGTVLQKARILPVDVVNMTAEVSDFALTDVASGNKVRAFVWNEGLDSIDNINNLSAEITAE